MGALNRWVYRVADGQLLMGIGLDPSVYPADSVNYAVCDLPDTDPRPSPKYQRAASATTIRAATALEQSNYDLEVADALSTSASRDRDLLAVFATMAEAYNPNWATMTNAQRRAEVVRLASREDQQRRWVERNYSFMYP